MQRYRRWEWNRLWLMGAEACLRLQYLSLRKLGWQVLVGFVAWQQIAPAHAADFFEGIANVAFFYHINQTMERPGAPASAATSSLEDALPMIFLSLLTAPGSGAERARGDIAKNFRMRKAVDSEQRLELALKLRVEKVARAGSTDENVVTACVVLAHFLEGGKQLAVIVQPPSAVVLSNEPAVARTQVHLMLEHLVKSTVVELRRAPR